MNAARALLLSLLLLGLPLERAGATEQVEEHLIVGGRVFRTPATPLEPFLNAVGANPFQAEILSSNLWRGYVGTWLLQDGGLYLVSLMRYTYQRKNAGPGRRVAKDIPLTGLFKDQAAPILATWWSGQLLVPRGRMLRHGWRSRDRLGEESLYLTVKKGRVVERLLVDNRREGRARSPEDIRWVMQAARPPADEGAWHDARLLRGAAFQKSVPSGTPFRTRGLLLTYAPKDVSLWIPRTPTTEIGRIPLRGLDALAVPEGVAHVELNASWHKEGRDLVLRVASIRALLAGETIHHPRFVVPSKPNPPRSNAGGAAAGDHWTEVETPESVDVLFGRLVTLRGTPVFDKVPTIHGVEVGIDKADLEAPVIASGLLQKWIVTHETLAADPAVARLFTARGPGTWYRLVDPATGALAQGRPAK